MNDPSIGSAPHSPVGSAPVVQAEVGFHYVLILEWLDDADERTGRLLDEHLRKIGVPSELVVCSSPRDIRESLNRALSTVPQRGRPAVHIEAHGTSTDDRGLGEMAFGTTQGSSLRWADLGDWLAPLNQACDFRLVVVGATCYGLGAIAAMKVNQHVAPFAACIGFTTTVMSSSVREAMKEFYRSIHRGDEFRPALANASRELRQGEKLEFTSAKKLAYQVLRGVYDRIRGEKALTETANRLLAQVRDAGLPVADSYVATLPTLLQERTRVRAQEAWDHWFPPQLQTRLPSNQLDWSIVEMDLIT